MPKRTAIILGALIIALLAWTGLILQFYTATIAYLAKGRTTGGTIIEILSFFTIQTNLLVAISLTTVAITKQSFFTKPSVLTAIGVYITIVSIVYNLVLRQLAHFTGITRLGDELVHLIVPVLYVAFWLAFISKGTLQWRNAFPWLWYPFFYLIYILVRGAFTNLYPYPFINVSNLGYHAVFVNIAVLMIVFLAVSMLYIFIARMISKRANKVG